MRNYILLFVTFFVLQSCNTENGWNCIQTVGDIVVEPFEVALFSRITVEDDIFLEIQQGEVQSVIVTTGSNLLNDISVTVEADGNLRLKNNNNCNFLREYDVTSIRVTTPILTNIRSSSRNKVTSINTLSFESLALKSNTEAGVISSGKSGDFDLNVAVDALRISANGASAFKISGTANQLNIGFLDENPFFQGENLIVQNLNFLQVSGNKMIVNPQQSISGSIRAVGDVISLNEPPIVDVEELFTGRLIFQ